MEGYRNSAHAIYRCEYHFVWVPKYRYQVLVPEIKSRLKEILVELCEWLDVSIIEGAIASDHVHMYLSVPPKHSPGQHHADIERQECGVSAKRVPRVGEEILGDAYLGPGVFCKYRGHGSRCHPQLCQRAARRPNKRRPASTYGETTANDNVRSCCPSLLKPPARPVVVYSPPTLVILILRRNADAKNGPGKFGCFVGLYDRSKYICPG